jgi:hypothetical protein
MIFMHFEHCGSSSHIVLDEESEELPLASDSAISPVQRQAGGQTRLPALSWVGRHSAPFEMQEDECEFQSQHGR